jgi:serpin B
LVVSPTSLSIGFAMTLEGARGETAAQLAQVLGFGEDTSALQVAAQTQLDRWNDPDRTGYDLRIANRLFVRDGTPLEPRFVAITRDRYGAPIEALRFSPLDATRRYINRWVAEQTEGHVGELLPPNTLTPLSRMVLANAVYFLGTWRHPFPRAGTYDGRFHFGGGQVARVPTMRVVERFGFARAAGVELLEMPYVGGDLSMVVVLPNERHGLPALEETLSAHRLEEWLAALEPQRVDVSLPRFRVEMAEPVALKPVLTAMGMPLAFTDDADFTGMSDPPNPAERLHIENAYHSASIGVDESGTEATAGTAVIMSARGIGPERAPERFTADRPFLFLLRDLQTGSLLFLGRLADPRSELRPPGSPPSPAVPAAPTDSTPRR